MTRILKRLYTKLNTAVSMQKTRKGSLKRPNSFRCGKITSMARSGSAKGLYEK